MNLTLEEPEHIYLVDHAWTFQVGQHNMKFREGGREREVKLLLCWDGSSQAATARQQLVNTPGLSSRMAALMDIEDDEEVPFYRSEGQIFCQYKKISLPCLWRVG